MFVTKTQMLEINDFSILFMINLDLKIKHLL